jgi:hypothetical protein
MKRLKSLRDRMIVLLVVGLPLLIAACQNAPGGPGY